MKSRLVFRHDGHEITAVIEGPEAWVKHFSDQIGLGIDSGWMMELTHGKGKDPLGPSSDEPILPGPPPDPSRIPAVIREIGSFDSTQNSDATSPPDLDENELKIFISEMPEPQIPPDSISMDPLTEEWLRLVMAIVITEHGLSSLTPQKIADLLSERTALDEIAVSLALKRLWASGKVDRILTDSGHEYAPSPSWIQVYRD